MGTLAKAVSLHQSGRLAEAEAIYRALLEIDPWLDDAAYLLGVVLAQTDRPAEAERLVRDAIARQATADRLASLGAICRTLEKPAEAEAAYRQALEMQPDHGGALFNHGNLLLAQDRLDDAARRFAQVMALDPHHRQARVNLGVVRQRQGRLAEAEQAFRSALTLSPHDAEAGFNLASLLEEQGREADAEGLYKRALSVKPDFAEAWHNLGALLERHGQRREAVACYGQALRHGIPRRGPTVALLLHQLAHLCQWDAQDRLRPELLHALETDREGGIPPWMLLSQPVVEEWHFRAARAHAAAVRRRAEALRPADLAPAVPRAPGGRLRIGYLSADLHQHPVGHVVVEVLECHDRRVVEVVGLSFGPDDGSAIRRRLVAGFDRFHDLAGLGPVEMARRIRALDLDILVDLMGFTARSRPEVVAMRPAPVTVQWIGFAGSTGGLTDYVIADGVVVPPGKERAYAEAVVRLPGSYYPGDSRRPLADPPGREAAGLPTDGFVFCCFNASYKITRDVFAGWMRILAQVPGSVLWLLEAGPEMTEALRTSSLSHGVDPDRLVFAPRLPKARMADHLGRHRLADLFLDTRPYGGHTTAGDALWAGLPVLTCTGPGFAARVAASLLTALNLPDLIAPSAPAYESLAVALARDPARLDQVRRRLGFARHRPGGPFDSAALARALERAYAAMADRARQGLPPAALSITPEQALL